MEFEVDGLVVLDVVDLVVDEVLVLFIGDLMGSDDLFCFFDEILFLVVFVIGMAGVVIVSGDDVDVDVVVVVDVVLEIVVNDIVVDGLDVVELIVVDDLLCYFGVVYDNVGVVLVDYDVIDVVLLVFDGEVFSDEEEDVFIVDVYVLDDVLLLVLLFGELVDM